MSAFDEQITMMHRQSQQMMAKKIQDVMDNIDGKGYFRHLVLLSFLAACASCSYLDNPLPYFILIPSYTCTTATNPTPFSCTPD
jgi:hypothetical protein